GIMFDYNDPGPGVLVDNVTAGKPAAKAGLKSGDRILEADGKVISAMNEGETPYMNLLAKFKPGQEITFTVDRNGERRKVKMAGE
ncbi:MAG TPA: PDZ domain-containing protein, partial [Gemmatales bacterium]|nr:PDZ domain-containing protein [Gemmatales bacterium]